MTAPYRRLLLCNKNIYRSLKMADQNKFEKMLELLVNEDKAAAQELFHEIVVEKSRDIYESLLEDEAEVDEATDEEVDEATDEEVDESEEEVDESDEDLDESDDDLEENFDLDTFEVEADDDMGGDPTDDMMADLGMDDEGEEGDEDEGEEGDVEDRVEDLEDALDDLKAEFEKMMAGDDEGDMDMDADDDEEEKDEAFAFEATDEEVDEATDEEVDEATDEEVEEAADEEVEEGEKSASETMREYVEKVSATMGDNGVNNTSAVAKPNNMGGTSGNLNQAGSDASSETGAGKKIAGSALNDQNAKDIGTGNINVPGGKAAKAGKTVPAGHGAEKKGAGETADKAAGSTLNKLSKRAK